MDKIIGKPFKLKQVINKLDPDVNYELKECKSKRTPSQNSLAWEYIGQLADVLRLSKEDVYLDMLSNYGQSMIMALRSDVTPSKWFKYYEVLDVNDEENTIIYRWIRGSSTYDTKEMSIFIDGVLQECENVGISTLTAEEISLLKIN